MGQTVNDCWCSCAFLSDIILAILNRFVGVFYGSISGSFHRDVLASFCITYPDLFLPVFLAQGWQEWTPETCCDRCFCILRFYLELSGACVTIYVIFWHEIDSRLTNWRNHKKKWFAAWKVESWLHREKTQIRRNIGSFGSFSVAGLSFCHWLNAFGVWRTLVLGSMR